MRLAFVRAFDPARNVQLPLPGIEEARNEHVEHPTG
jgi:hypothetical protein